MTRASPQKLRRARAHLPPLTLAVTRDAPAPAIATTIKRVPVYGGQSHVPMRFCSVSLPRVRFLEHEP